MIGGEESAGMEALFGGGKFAVSFEESDTPSWQKSRNRVSILNSDGRNEWFVGNINKYLKGRIGGTWFGVLKELTNDIDSSVEVVRRAGRLSSDEKSKITESRKETIAAMAVSGAARAMEGSAGSAKTYLTILCGARDSRAADAGIQDTLDDVILHDHPERLEQVLKIKGVDEYFKKILRDAGIVDTSFKQWDRKTQSTFEFQPNVIEELVAGNLSLVERFSQTSERFEGYINNVVESKTGTKDLTAEFVQARLAADVFLVDIFTRWQYSLMKEIESLSDERLVDLKISRNDLYNKVSKMRPIESWGGDPLVALLEPSILPRRFKGVYSGNGKIILDKLDAAFRPTDAISTIGDSKISLLPASMAVNLKAYDRFSDALMEILGGSMASGVASFDARVGEPLSKTVDLLVQVYGGLKTDTDDPVGKDLVGLMVSRIIECKALAAVSASADPSLGMMLGIIFEEEGGKGKSPRPFLEAKKTLWGNNLDGRDGLLASWASPRIGLRFKSNRFEAQRHIKEAWELLDTNAQTKGQRDSMKQMNKFSIAMDAVEAINEAFFKGRS